jgi:hypothetical protein
LKLLNLKKATKTKGNNKILLPDKIARMKRDKSNSESRTDLLVLTQKYKGIVKIQKENEELMICT